MKLVKYIIYILAIALTLHSSVAFAASEVDSKLSETKDAVQKLLQIKDDTTLPPQERARLELQLKKSIVGSILDVSSAQLKEARERLLKVSFPASEDWDRIKNSTFNSLDEYEKFYRDAKGDLQANGMTLDKTKSLAQRIEDKKTGEIDAFVREATNMSAAFGISDILKLADERLAKVESDVEKVYAQKLTQKNELRDSLQKASKAIADAQEINNRTKEIILHLYEPSETGSSDDFTASFEKEVRAYMQEKAGTSTAAGSALTAVTRTQKEEYLQELIRQSAEQVRNAYDIFLQMSVSVKSYIKE